jgi:RNA polymerase-binding transcription factor DksA
MTEAEITSYRQQLLALKKRHGGMLSDLEGEALRPVGGEPSGGLSNLPVHPADLSADSYEEEVTLGLLENEEQVLAEVTGALIRIEQGTFGRCANCGRAISRKRLQALPYACYCLRCAEELQSNARS